MRHAGDDRIVATAGTTATCPANVWHAFTNCGTGRLLIVCIHASDEIVQEDFPPADAP